MTCAVMLSTVCVDPVCVDPDCVDPVCADPVCADPVCADPVSVDREFRKDFSRPMLPAGQAYAYCVRRSLFGIQAL
jgi:hypothetical protein